MSGMPCLAARASRVWLAPAQVAQQYSQKLDAPAISIANCGRSSLRKTIGVCPSRNVCIDYSAQLSRTWRCIGAADRRTALPVDSDQGNAGRQKRQPSKDTKGTNNKTTKQKGQVRDGQGSDPLP